MINHSDIVFFFKFTINSLLENTPAFSILLFYPRPIPVPPQTASPRMVNLCQATQTTIIAPNPMLQGALLMQQMQGTAGLICSRNTNHHFCFHCVLILIIIYCHAGNMRGFGMGGQQFRQFFAASNRSSLLGPVPMGMAIKSPIMGFPAARPFHPHTRFFNNNIAAAAAATTSYSSGFVTTTVITTIIKAISRRLPVS